MTVLVTGGNGLLGRRLIKQLVTRYKPSDIIVFDRYLSDCKPLKDLGVTLIEGDICKYSSVLDVMQGIDRVFHLVSLMVETTPKKDMIAVNVGGTQNIVDAMIETGAKQIIYISSTQVYGIGHNQDPLPENTKLKAKTTYQTTKCAAEKIIQKANKEHGLNTCILRPPSLMGPRDFMTTYEAIQALFKKKVPMIDGGKRIKSYIHINDLVKVLMLIDGNEKAYGEIFNVISFSEPIHKYFNTVADLVGADRPVKNYNYRVAYSYAVYNEVLGKVLGKKTSINRTRIAKFARANQYSMKKIQSVIDYEPEYTLDSALEDTIEWFMDNGWLIKQSKKLVPKSFLDQKSGIPS